MANRRALMTAHLHRHGNFGFWICDSKLFQNTRADESI